MEDNPLILRTSLTSQDRENIREFVKSVKRDARNIQIYQEQSVKEKIDSLFKKK